LVAGISYFIEGSGLEITRSLIRTYSHDDLAAAREAIACLVAEGAAFVVKDVAEAQQEEEVCLVMLKYPGGQIPFLGWSRWFNQALARCSFLPADVVADHMLPE
jgi:hypothetical protein